MTQLPTSFFSQFYGVEWGGRQREKGPPGEKERERKRKRGKKENTAGSLIWHQPRFSFILLEGGNSSFFLVLFFPSFLCLHSRDETTAALWSVLPSRSNGTTLHNKKRGGGGQNQGANHACKGGRGRGSLLICLVVVVTLLSTLPPPQNNFLSSPSSLLSSHPLFFLRLLCSCSCPPFVTTASSQPPQEQGGLQIELLRGNTSFAHICKQLSFRKWKLNWETHSVFPDKGSNEILKSLFFFYFLLVLLLPPTFVAAPRGVGKEDKKRSIGSQIISEKGLLHAFKVKYIFLPLHYSCCCCGVSR